MGQAPMGASDSPRQVRQVTDCLAHETNSKLETSASAASKSQPVNKHNDINDQLQTKQCFGGI